MFSILGRKELADGCGVDALGKRRGGSAVVTFIPFGSRASVKHSGGGISNVALKSSPLKYFLRISISSSEAYVMAFGKKVVREFKGFLWSSKPEDSLCNSQKVVGVDHRSLPCEAKT